jgi:hypothetical protein
MPSTASTLAAVTPTDLLEFFDLLDRARAVRDAALDQGITISTRQCAVIAAADPSSAESMADAIEDSDHVPLLAAAHDEVTLRGDGWVIPDGGEWEATDGTSGWFHLGHSADADPNDLVEELLDEVEPSDRSVCWTYTVTIAGVSPRGYAEELSATGSRDVHPVEPPCRGREREPPCRGRDEHEWHAPHSLVGGCETNPGVFGSGYGTVYTVRVCACCGLKKTTDYGATNRYDGSQMTTVEYEYEEDRADD